MIETTDISRLIEENNRLKAELINFQKTTNELELLKDENFRMKMKMQRLLSRLKDKTDSISQHIIDTDLQKREIQAQAESFLMESIEYEKLSIVARKTDNAVVIMDAKGNLEWVNDGFERLYEISFAELIQTKGKNIIDKA